MSDSRDPALEAPIAAATRALLDRQQPDGHWVFELEADATIPAEYVLFRHYLAEPVDAELEAISTVPQDEVADGKRQPIKQLAEDQLLAKFVLLRWDQLQELAYHLLMQNADASGTKLAINKTSMKKALRATTDARLEECTAYQDFLKDLRRGVRDFSKEVVWVVDEPIPVALKDAPFFRSANDKHWCTGSKDLLQKIAPGLKTEFSVPGHVTFRTV